MRASWLERREDRVGQRIVLAPLWLASLAYGLGARIHRSRSAGRSRRLGCRVVSVGSLMVGGSGKTPLAAWVARSLCERGHRVAIATRGYGRKGHSRVDVVSDGARLRVGPELAGDEPLVLASHAPGVPVLVGRDRGRVGLRAVALFGSEILVLDDGFQHHRLARDVDIVTFDAGFGFGTGAVLPRGPLREPARALASADVIAVLEGPLREEDEARVIRLAPNALRIAATRRPVHLRSLSDGPSAPPEVIRDVEVGMIAGLARVAGFRSALEALGARVVAERVFADHHRYRAADLERLVDSDAKMWITTEKDAVKILPSWRRGADLRVLRSELCVERSDRFLDWLEARTR